MTKAKQRTIATVIALLILTELLVHFCFKVLDEALFSDLQITTEIAIISAIMLLVVLFFREELFLDLAGGGSRSVRKKGGVRYGKKVGKSSKK